MTDERVLHYWDRERVVGTRYLAHLPAMLDRRAPETVVPTADAMWDAFYVYGRGVKWQDPAPLPISWGYPIMVTREQLVRDLQQLGESKESNADMHKCGDFQRVLESRACREQ